MSLDVHLYMPKGATTLTGSGIFIRENGATIEISREEWDKRYPNREPCVVNSHDSDDESTEDCVFSQNITHNLNTMAGAAGIYMHLWRPEELGISTAHELIPHLKDGLAELQTRPEKYKELNPPNGWGNYDNLVQFTASYLKACMKYPDARVSVCR